MKKPVLASENGFDVRSMYFLSNEIRYDLSENIKQLFKMAIQAENICDVTL